MQDAAPVRLGQEFGGYARAVERDIETLQASRQGLLRIGIGGTAVGTGSECTSGVLPTNGNCLCQSRLAYR